jgi:hypothetical protein
MVDMKHRRTREECQKLLLLFFLEAFPRAGETEVEVDGFHTAFQSVLNNIKKKLGPERELVRSMRSISTSTALLDVL